jgi:hypothetical protein
MNKIVKEYRDIFASPVGVSLHYYVKHSIELILDAPLPNGSIYIFSLLENEEIKCLIHDLIQPSSSPCGIPIELVQKKDGKWKLCIDYRSIKKITIKNQYLIPHIDDHLD